MSEVVVYATLSQAASARGLLAEACRSIGVAPRLELFGSGSLFQRLRARRAAPQPDVLLWFGPYAAHVAADQNLVQTYQPHTLPTRGMHHPNWLWTAVDFQPFRVSGAPPAASLDDLPGLPRLALADPERSEVGLMLLLATLDRMRQRDGGADAAWSWWAQRVRSGVRLVDDDESALVSVRSGRATHAITLGDQGTPLLGLAPVPHAIALAADAPNVEPARQLIDWLVSESAPSSSGRLSAWRAGTDGLEALLDAAPALDVSWCTQQYAAARRRWAQSGFGPALDST